MNKNMFPTNELDETIERTVQHWGVPGVAVGILKNNEPLLARGYGVKALDKPSPVNAETNFAIGSNTKAFTAACLGMLVEEGELDWDDKVIRYLPEFAVYDPWVSREVTVRDILSHRIGVSDIERFLYNTTISNAEVIRRLRYVQPAVPFRSDFRYSNIGFMAAGEILRVVTGENWETLVQKRIFEPLGMIRSTTNFERAAMMENVAMPHVNGTTSILSIRARMLDSVHPIPWYPFGSQAAGGITSNVLDMAKWLGLFLGKGTYQGKTVLQPETVAMMTRPTNVVQNPIGSMASLAAVRPEINFWTYGLGWFIVDYKGHKMVFHGGQVQGMISVCGFLPQENLGFVILTNINLSVLTAVLCLTICDRFLGGSQREWNQEYLDLVRMLRKSEENEIQKLQTSRDESLMPSLPMEAFTGTYDHDYFGEHSIHLEDGRLILCFAPNNTGDLEHWQGNTFFVHWREDPFDGGFLTFSTTPDGQVQGFEIQNEGFFKRVLN